MIICITTHVLTGHPIEAVLLRVHVDGRYTWHEPLVYLNY